MHTTERDELAYHLRHPTVSNSLLKRVQLQYTWMLCTVFCQEQSPFEQIIGRSKYLPVLAEQRHFYAWKPVGHYWQSIVVSHADCARLNIHFNNMEN